MELRSIEVKYIHTYAGYMCVQDGLRHRKTLPYFSAVQATEGRYEIALGDGPVVDTGEGGVFLAPREEMQDIVHRVSPVTGRMQARWLFADIRINGQYPLEAVYELPPLLPREHAALFGRVLEAMRQSDDLCDQLAELFRFIKVLLAVARPKKREDPRVTAARDYVAAHYTERITPAQLAQALYVSEPTLFRLFQAEIGAAPSRYVNDVRLAQAVLLLETTALPIAQIGASVGIDDVFYLSKLFKRKYGLSPTAYRRRFFHDTPLDNF